MPSFLRVGYDLLHDGVSDGSPPRLILTAVDAVLFVLTEIRRQRYALP